MPSDPKLLSILLYFYEPECSGNLVYVQPYSGLSFYDQHTVFKDPVLSTVSILSRVTKEQMSHPGPTVLHS